MAFINLSDIDMAQFIGPTKYSFEEICHYLNIDTSDEMVKYLLNVDSTISIEMDKRHLNMMGITRKQFRKLLHSNPQIEFDEKTNRINSWDFESLCMQVDNDVCRKFRQKSKQIQHAFTKYWQYNELYYRTTTMKTVVENKKK